MLVDRKRRSQRGEIGLYTLDIQTSSYWASPKRERWWSHARVNLCTVFPVITGSLQVIERAQARLRTQMRRRTGNQIACST